MSIEYNNILIEYYNDLIKDYLKYDFQINYIPSLLRSKIKLSTFKNYLNAALKFYSAYLLPYKELEYNKQYNNEDDDENNKKFPLSKPSLFLKLYQNMQIAKLINNSLRLKLSTPFLKHFIYKMNQEISHNGLSIKDIHDSNEPLILYRAINNQYASEIYGKKIGQIFLAEGYVSQTPSLGVAEEFLNLGIILKIHYTSDIKFNIMSIYKNSYEFLTYPNIKYQIIDKYMTDDYIVIELNYIEDYDNDVDYDLRRLILYRNFDQYFRKFLKIINLDVYDLYKNFYRLYLNCLKNYQLIKEIVKRNELEKGKLRRSKIEKIEIKNDQWFEYYNDYILELAKKDNRVKISEESELFRFSLVYKKKVEMKLMKEVKEYDSNLEPIFHNIHIFELI